MIDEEQIDIDWNKLSVRQKNEMMEAVFTRELLINRVGWDEPAKPEGMSNKTWTRLLDLMIESMEIGTNVEPQSRTDEENDKVYAGYMLLGRHKFGLW